MSTLTIINLFLASSIITTLIIGVVLNLKSIEINKYQSTLLTTFTFWIVIMFYGYVKYFFDIQPGDRTTISYISDICGMQVLLIGSVCFFSLVIYPILVLQAKYLVLKNWIARIKPTIIIFAIYFLVNFFLDIDPFIKYTTLDEFTSQIATVPVALRLLLLVSLIYVWGSELRRLAKLVPYYNEYITDNFADNHCNVDWVRTLIRLIAIESCAFCVMLFLGSPLMNLIYLSIVLIMFAYMINMSLFYRTSEGIETLDIMRDPKNPKGYIAIKVDKSKTKFKFVETSEETQCQKCTKTTTSLEQINRWMESESPYSNIQFSTNDILEAFPHLTRNDLTIMFHKNKESFQSYVKRFRIRKACEIMSSQDELESYNQQIYAVVGFSHYSSFSRSFVSLLHISPSKFMKLNNEDKGKLIEKLQDNYLAE